MGRKYDQNSFWQRLCWPCSQSPNPRRKCDTHVRLHNIFALRSQHLCFYIFTSFTIFLWQFELHVHFALTVSSFCMSNNFASDNETYVLNSHFQWFCSVDMWTRYNKLHFLSVHVQHFFYSLCALGDLGCEDWHWWSNNSPSWPSLLISYSAWGTLALLQGKARQAYILFSMGIL